MSTNVRNPKGYRRRHESLPTQEESLEMAKQALMHEQQFIPEAPSDREEDRSVVFVSIDFENGPDNREGVIRVREMGISILDSRELICHKKEPHEMIQTQNFRCQKKPGSWYLFGQSTTVQQKEMGEILERALRQYDPNGKLRRVNITAHAVLTDLDTMRKCFGIDITDRDKYPSVVGVVDTELLSKTTFLMSELAFESYMLQSILETLSVPYAFLHTAGNDANFTLKALLMLCVRYLETDDSIDPRQEEKLAVIRCIAQASIESDLRNASEMRSRIIRDLVEVRTEKGSKTSVAMQENPDAGSSDPGKRESGNVSLVEKHHRRSENKQRGNFSTALSFQDSLDLLKSDLFPPAAKPVSVTANTSTLFVGVDFKLIRGVELHGADITQAQGIRGAGFCTFDTESLAHTLQEPLALSTENLNAKRGQETGKQISADICLESPKICTGKLWLKPSSITSRFTMSHVVSCWLCIGPDAF